MFVCRLTTAQRPTLYGAHTRSWSTWVKVEPKVAKHAAVSQDSTKDKLLEDLHAKMKENGFGDATNKKEATSSDPNTDGFVPTYLAGDLFACKLPAR